MKEKKEEKKVTKKEKGITLIALIITIIVILILAAVSISTLAGENGIITKAQSAVELTRLAQLQEECALRNIEIELGTAGSDEEFIQQLIDLGYVDEEEKDDILANGYIEVGDIKIDITTGNSIVDSETEIQLAADTYFYDSTTVDSDELIRYKKVEGMYYICNENGMIENESENVDVNTENLVEYTNASVSNLTLGTGAVSLDDLILGNGQDMFDNSMESKVQNMISAKGTPTATLTVPEGVEEGYLILNASWSDIRNPTVSDFSGTGIEEIEEIGSFSCSERSYLKINIYKVKVIPGNTISVSATFWDYAAFPIIITLLY